VTQRYDVIVIGVGAMGSAACWQLARRGVRVLGLEQFDVPHGLGSSGGHSRLIRLAYYEHADYVPLLRRAYELWDEIEADSAQKVLHITGGIYMGRPHEPFVAESLKAAQRHDLPHEMLDRPAITARFPQFQLPADFAAFFENKAGLLLSEKAVAAHAEAAMRHGAEIHGRETVLDWSADNFGITVTTDKHTYSAGHVIFTAGAWTSRLVEQLGVKLKVTRQVMGWTWPRTPELVPSFALGTLPCWAVQNDDGSLHYGMPMLPDVPGVKVAHHFHGPVTDIATMDRMPQPSDEDDFRGAIQRYLPGADGPLLSMRVCLYTCSPDSHFIVDHLPGRKNVTIACGFSGHGFKFASVMGEALADLATRGRTALPIEFLGLSRFR